MTERTEAEMRDALHRFCQAAWEPRAPVRIFSIPPQADDADMILADAIDELLARRAQAIQETPRRD